MPGVTRNRARLTRNTALLVTGLAGVIHEVVLRDVDRPALLALLGAMMGLPAVLRSDEKGSKDE